MEFILEILGFSLTVLEIFFPRKALLLEDFIDSLPKRAPHIFYGKFLSQTNIISNKILSEVSPELSAYGNIAMLSPFQSLLFHLKNLFFTIVIFGVIGAVFGGLAAIFIELTGFYAVPTGLIAVYGIALIVSTFGVLVTILSLLSVLIVKFSIGLLNFITNGRAIGALGLIIAGWGLVSKYLLSKGV